MNDVQKEVEAILQEAGNGFVDSFNEDKLRELITAALNRRSPALSAIEADRNKRAVAPDTPQEWKEAGALSDEDAQALHRAADTLDDLGAPHNAAEVRAILAAQGRKA